MQSSPPNLESNHTLIKWLPAISLAVLINVIFIGIFLFSNQVNLKKIEDNVSQKESLPSKGGDGIEVDNKTETDNLNTNSDDESIETINSKNTKASSNKQVYVPFDDNPKNNDDQKLTSSSSDSSKVEEADSESVEVENNSNIKANAVEPSSPKPKLEYIAPVNEQNIDLGASVNSSGTNYINPNDRFLLPIDIPSSEHSNVPELLPEDEGFNEVAEETMRINDQLTKAIDEVKEQKLQQIADDQARVRAAYEERQKTLGSNSN